jgi:hypothetical protein
VADKEQEERLDGGTPRLLKEPDLLRNGKEIAQCAMREVDDRDGAVAGKDAVESAIWPRVSPISAMVAIPGR